MLPSKNYDLRALQFAVVVLPLLYWPRFGNWVHEPKLVALLLGAGVVGIATLLHDRQPPFAMGRASRAVAMLASGLLLIQVLSGLVAPNFGQYLVAIATTAAAFGLGIMVFRSCVPTSAYLAAVVVASALLALIALLELYAGVSVLGRELFWGLPIGGRNYLPIYLAIALPLVEAHAGDGTTRLGRAGARIALLVALMVVALIFRTRAVWLVIAAQTASYGLLALGAARYRALFRTRVAVLAIAVAIIAWVPSHLQWKSSSPYADSVRSLVGSDGSGRREMWDVAAQIALSHPLLGVGAGQYPVVSRGLIPRYATHPERFAFLTPDSSAFNDYIQAASETGLLGAALLVLLYLVTPLWLLWQTWRQQGTRQELLLACSLVSAGALAMFSNSVDRPEQLLLVACTFALLLRQRASAAGVNALPPTVFRKRCVRSGRWALALVPLSVGSMLLVRFAIFSTPMTPGGNTAIGVIAPDLAYAVWPWDRYWNMTASHYYVGTAGHFDSYEAYVGDRLRYWPDDPEAHQVTAQFAQRRGERNKALYHWTRAIQEVRGGRCRSGPARLFAAYAKSLRIDVAAVADDSVKQCLASELTPTITWAQ